MKARAYQLTVDLGSFLIRQLERLIGRQSMVGTPAFFESDGFPWIRQVERQWALIRQELEVVLERRDELPSFHEISRGQQRISDDRWKTFFLYAYGFKADGNCRRCPVTTRIVEAIPGMKTAFFSILAPGKHIPAHRGPYRGVIRYHLGLKVPEPRDRCRIRVGDEIRHWEEGKSLVFVDRLVALRAGRRRELQTLGTEIR